MQAADVKIEPEIGESDLELLPILSGETPLHKFGSGSTCRRDKFSLTLSESQSLATVSQYTGAWRGPANSPDDYCCRPSGKSSLKRQYRLSDALVCETTAPAGPEKEALGDIFTFLENWICDIVDVTFGCTGLARLMPNLVKTVSEKMARVMHYCRPMNIIQLISQVATTTDVTRRAMIFMTCGERVLLLLKVAA